MIKILLSLLFLFSWETPVRADDYLDALNAEAAFDGEMRGNETYVELLEKESSDIDPATVHERVKADKHHLESGLDMRNFERRLRSRFPGIYRDYSRLDSPGKAEAYLAYTRNNAIRSLRRTILDIRIKALAAER